MKQYAAMALALAIISGMAHAGRARITEVRYQGDDGGASPVAAQYRNPILAGFYPDPSLVRAGDDFYLVNSSFGYFPGLPVFHSRNLVDWQQVANAIDRPGQVDLGQHELTRGLFAASISEHDGTFYITNTCFYCDLGNFVITAKDPAGPWSDPHWLGFEGIDPSLFFDRDGSAWVVNNGLPAGKMRYDGHRAIWLQRLDLKTLQMVGPRTVLVDAGANPSKNPEHIEGPHLFRHGDYYYLTAAEGGTGEQHAQMVYRSRALAGPYEAWPDNPSLSQRDLDPARPAPITSAGHAQFVELQDGSWWAVFLATRPYEGNHYNIGRETFLLPVRWEDGWPRILAHGQAIPELVQRPPLPHTPGIAPRSGPMSWRETFTATQLPLAWVSINVPHTAWYTTGGDGLRLTPSPTPLGEFAAGQPSYLAHRLQHHHATISTRVDASGLDQGEHAGLALLQNESHYYALALSREPGRSVVSLWRRDSAEQPKHGVVIASAALPAAVASAQLRFHLAGATLQAEYAVQPDHWQVLRDDLDARVLSTQTAGGFIGTTFGPYAWRN
ncbi:MAG TPA: glycoside hydrolase family 43 protein [Stenotrophomonas sp.]|nr:glycoside hydrolase family 43 protein [Stenotrophomonas sp.]